MKRFLLTIAAVVVIIGAGYFFWQFGRMETSVSSNPASSAAAAASQSVSSALSQSSSTVSSAVESEAPAQSLTPQQKQMSIKKIQSAINLNWKKYTLKKSYAKKTISGKSYLTFEIWDEDYIVGPTILVDPDTEKVYTWTQSDPAPIPAADDKAFDKTVHALTGTMLDGAMMSIVLKGPDGSELNFRRLGIDTSGLTSMKIGDKIKVTYTGVIKGSDTSRAFVTKLETVK